MKEWNRGEQREEGMEKWEGLVKAALERLVKRKRRNEE